MFPERKPLRLVLFGVPFLLIYLSGLTRAQEYVFEDLGFLPGFPSCISTGINETGQIVGECCLTNQAEDFCDCQGFLWQDGEMFLMPVIPDREGSTPLAINKHGHIVGMAWACNETNHAFLLIDGVILDLNELIPPQSGWLLTRAVDINDVGQIIGRGKINGEGHAFLFQNGQVIDLGTLGGGFSRPSDINNQGQVVGGSTNMAGDFHAFLWQKGMMEDLHPFHVRSDYSLARGINDHGAVVGSFRPRSLFVEYPFFWEEGKFTLLPHGKNLNSWPIAINNGDFIVGGGDRFNNELLFHNVANLWRKSEILDLDELIVRPNDYPIQPYVYPLGIAEDINQMGQIIGVSRSDSYQFHAFVLTPRRQVRSLLEGAKEGTRSLPISN